jgi:8-oxo-dGTP pyrophosphatase MutT (NUDIX family)
VVDAAVVRGRLELLGSRPFAALPGGLVPRDWSASAVLILMWGCRGATRLALIRRSSTLRTQPGMVALPGGVCGETEEPAQAALRETEEELGVPRDAITVMGRLDDHWSSARHSVAAFVGWHSGEPAFRPGIDEVAEVYLVDLDDLLDEANHSLQRIVYEDDVLRLGSVTVTGMTADILVDLRDWIRGSDRRRVPARSAGLSAYLKM